MNEVLTERRKIMAYSVDLFEAIKPSFEKLYVYYEEVLIELCTAWVESHDKGGDGSNLILWGPGGYGKSRMAFTFATEVLKLEQSNEMPFVQSFGSSTTEDAVWGGYDYGSMTDKRRLEFAVEDSFLARPIAILEEFFDIPGRVAEDLKDTLEAREFRRGAFRYPMKTRSIIVCTNQNPDDVERRSSSMDALLQRFPARVEVKWPRHEASDYLAMFNKQVPELRELAPIMANLIPSFAKKGSHGVAPRLAISGLKSVIKRARARGRKYVIDTDFQALAKRVPFNKQSAVLSQALPDLLRRFGGTLVLNRLRTEIEPRVKKIQDINNLPKMGNPQMEEYASLTAELQSLRSQILDIQIPGESGEGFKLKQTLAEEITKVLRDSKKGSK